MSVTIGGTFSGLNVSQIIQTIIAADSVPITALQKTDTDLNTQSTDLGTLGTSLGELSATLQTLTSSLFTTQAATSSNTTLGTATVDATAKPGTTNLNITQLATNTVLRSGSTSSSLGNAKLTAVPAGTTDINTAMGETTVAGQTFTINGKQITLSDSDVIDDGNPTSTSSVIGLINNSGAGVTASYNSSTGQISLSSSSPIILGAASDTSDFLQQAQLFNNGTGSVSSSLGIGRLDPNTSLTSDGLTTPITAGTFTINGVPITVNSGDTLNTLIGNINSSNAGVTAVYDTYEDQLVLTSNTKGPQNITVTDGTSNAATALRLGSSDSQLQEGVATLFTVGSDPTVRQSASNIITGSQMGVQGLTFNATNTGSTQITVAPDVTTIANAINAFVTQYNSTQTLIAQDTAVNPSDADQDGPLAADNNFTFLASQLRQVTSSSISNTATIRMLSDLGVNTNANDNTLTQVDTTDLQNALTNNLGQLQALFNDPVSGLTTTVQNVLDAYNDSLNGVIIDEQNQITQQITFNKNQITEMQAQMDAEQTNLENEFALLDSVEASGQGLSGVLNSSSGASASSSSSSSSSSSGSSSFGSVGSSAG